MQNNRFIALAVLFLTIAASASVKPNSRSYKAVPDTQLLVRPFDAKDAGLFKRPPRIFYPETWFHFVNGNISRTGITQDLEAIAGAGITGVQLFHGKIGNPADWPGTEEHIECLSPKWEELVSFTASEAHRLGLRFSLQTCPGWAMSGGPWIKPEQAMRHLAMSRIDVNGGAVLDTLLTTPVKQDWQDWQDIAVLAFPTPTSDSDKPLVYKWITASDPQQQAQWEALLRDGKEFTLPPTTDDKPHIVFVELEYPGGAHTIEFNPIDNFNHSFSVQPDIHLRVLTVQQNETPQVVLDTNFPHGNWQDSQHGMSFALKPLGQLNRFYVQIANQHTMRLTSLRFYSGARGHNWEAEAGWTSRTMLRPIDWPNENPRDNANFFVHRGAVRDISSAMDASGRLHWNAPDSLDGRRIANGWTILRIGHVNTGQRNGPAPEEATGWEVNKFDTAFVSHQFRSYIGRLADGSLKGLIDNMLMDSWECRSQTWTRYMEQEFRQRRKYEVRLWLPAIFGFVMGDREQTSQFLDDWRRTLNELFVDNFYGHMSRLAREKGMTVSYETAAGDIFPADPMEYYKYADVPMTEFWQPFSHMLSNHNFKPIRPTASAARMYGKPRVSAEAFTSFDLNWDEHLSMLREVANQNMVEGVSHLVFHTYTHNPKADQFEPGTSFGGAIGTPFLRRQTWWYAMPHFNSCMARCAYLLERGKPVSSVLWYLGDETQQKPDQKASFPEGFLYDYCNTDALLHRITVKDGKWVTPEGIQYDVLWLPDSPRMLPEVASHLQSLAMSGGVIVGDAPLSIATLSNDNAQQWRWRWAVNSLWNDSSNGEGARVLQGCTLQQALDRLGLKPDVKPTSIRWSHRQAEGADWYFVCPLKEQGFDGDVSFLQQGRVELWNPMTGQVTPIPSKPDGDYTRIHLRLERGESLFVMFRHDGLDVPVTQWTDMAQYAPSVPWTITFPEGWGITEPVRTEQLAYWKDLPLSPEGRSFSGTALYETQIDIPRMTKGHRYVLSLGDVEEIAVVEMNGRVCDTLWAAPYECDVTRYVKKGRNRVRLRVTSTWHNRLAYDASQPEADRRTCVINGPRTRAALRPSGLKGPVVMNEQAGR